MLGHVIGISVHHTRGLPGQALMRPALTDLSGTRAAAYQILPVYASGMEIRHAFRMLVKDPGFTIVQP